MTANDRTWDLSILYNGFDDPAFQNDLDVLDGAITGMNRLAKEASALSDADLVRRWIEISEQMSDVSGKLFIYANLRYSADTGDTDAASVMGRLMNKLSANAEAEAVLNQRLAAVADIEAVIVSGAAPEEYRYLLNSIRDDAKYQLSEKEEALFAKMNISGASAWSDLQSSLTSTVRIDYRGDAITLPAVRNLAYDPDPLSLTEIVWNSPNQVEFLNGNFVNSTSSFITSVSFFILSVEKSMSSILLHSRSGERFIGLADMPIEI